MPSELVQRCESLLHYEYLLTKERAKNIVHHESLMVEVTQAQQESEELARDREKYTGFGEQEKLLLAEQRRIDQNKAELEQLWQGLHRMIGESSELIEMAKRNNPAYRFEDSPVNLNKGVLLGSNYKLGGGSNDLVTEQSSNPINPYSETINVRTGPALLMVVNQYRDEDPLIRNKGATDLQTLIERTLEGLDQTQKITGEQVQGSQESTYLRQIRRMLVRDAYFL